MIEKTSYVATQAGAGAALVFGLTPSEWSVIGVIGGLAFAALGFVVNVVFQYLRWKKEGA